MSSLLGCRVCDWLLLDVVGFKKFFASPPIYLDKDIPLVSEI